MGWWTNLVVGGRTQHCSKFWIQKLTTSYIFSLLHLVFAVFQWWGDDVVSLFVVVRNRIWQLHLIMLVRTHKNYISLKKYNSRHNVTNVEQLTRNRTEANFEDWLWWSDLINYRCCSRLWGETVLNCSHQQAYCSSSSWYTSMESHGGIDRGKPKKLEQNLSQCHSVHNKSHMDCLPQLRNQAFAVRDRQLTAWDMARPNLIWQWKWAWRRLCGSGWKECDWKPR
jgi:hypothetical protein